MPDQKAIKEGGFMMSDKNIPDGRETLYSIMKTHFDKTDNKQFFNSVLQQKDKPPPDKKDLSFLDTPDYKEIYTKLINIIMTDEVYTQTFSDGGSKPFYTQRGMHNYHIQLCALMTMSFLIELELFSVVHNYIPINIGITGSAAEKNRLPSIYAHSEHKTTTPLRCYKDLIANGVEAMLTYFTQSLDTFFNNFMNLLLVKIEEFVKIISRQEILEAIVPINSKNPPHVDKTFDYIYVDWKNRIKKKIKTNSTTGYSDDDDKTYSICINAAIEEALKEVEEGGSRYIAEGTGFFSFLYLLAAVEGVVYNGSCITYSMLELYIMARLHVHANNLILEMESAHSYPHQYWKSVQTDTDINLRSVTHWTTKYNFQSNPLHFRHVFTDSIKSPSGKPSFNFLDPDKPKLCLLLLYPIFDSYIQYIGPMTDTANKNIVSDFIKTRIAFVKTLFTTHKTVSKHVSERGARGRDTGTEAKVAPILKNWFSEVFGFDEKSFAANKASFKVGSDKDHILMTVKFKEIDIGVFRYVSVADLLKTATNNPSARSVFGFDSTTNLKYYTMTSPTHTVHMNPSYSGSIFQVASQFNALEMASPELTPQNGITIYWDDNTQGPACAMVCPFGTLYRNYFCMPDTGGNQPEDKSVNGNPQTGTATGGTDPGNNQINTLTDLKTVDKCFDGLTFQNGYIFVKNKDQLDIINKYLSTPENFWKAMMAIKYVIQEDTPVVDVTTGDGKILDQIVSQIYCSAYPVAYSISGTTNVPDTSAKDYALLSSMILHAVYYSTLAYAVTRITPDETRKKVFLTRVGGGVFKNDNYIIDTAIYNAVSHFIAYPIDVYIVGYQKNAEGQAKITDPEEIDDVKLKSTIVTNSLPVFNTAPYTDIQKMLAERATAETEKVKKATDEMVTKIKKETELRSSLKKSTEDEKKEKLYDEAKAKVKEEKAKKNEEDRIHEEKTRKKHLNLTQAIDEAIKTFSEKLAEGGDDDYAKILDDLMTEINKDRDVIAKADAEADAKSKTEKKTKGIGLDDEADKVKRAKNMDQVVDTIELNVDIGSDTRDKAATVTKKFNRIETGGGGDCLFHTLRYLLTTAGKFSPTGNKTADMMTIRNAIVDHVQELGDEFKHLQVPIGDKLDFKKNNETLVKYHSGKSDSKIANLNINVDGAVRIDGSRLLFADRVVTFKQDLRGDDKHMKYVSQDMTKNYFTVMKEQGTYGTEFELGIAAALYDIMLCVISDERRCQYYIFDKVKNEVRGNEPGEYERNKKNIWYIYNYTNTHYQYLKCIDEPAECPDPVKL